VNFFSTGIVETIILHGIVNEVMPYFVNFSFDMGWLWYRSSRNAVAGVKVFCEVGQWKTYFTEGRQWNITHIFYTLLPIMAKFGRCPQKPIEWLWVS